MNFFNAGFDAAHYVKVPGVAGNVLALHTPGVSLARDILCLSGWSAATVTGK